MVDNQSLRDKKVMTIKIVKELTGLSERKIRYYEERKLIFPARTSTGNRMFSFSDIEKLMEIAEKLADGVQTDEIRKDIKKRENKKQDQKKEMIKGQLNSHFNRKLSH
ncbi:MerR family transcriptional regulator [Bacillus massiliglaciei]|uniref:MerR family transcriptional regulator n=1 Tax=Bacillus massiliglaciei TaxID=1816693 RepID=UPI000AE4CDB5|nr:MerR family transcriptional regulator [Bacillus massiliglaciei]